MLHSFPGGQIKGMFIKQNTKKKHFNKFALGEGLEGIEFGEENQSFNVLKPKPKVGVNAIFLYDSYRIYQYTLFKGTSHIHWPSVF